MKSALFPIRRSRLLSSIATVASLVFAIATDRPVYAGEDPVPIRIGAISPFTGDGARYGEAARSGIDLAVSEINAKGGIHGRQVSIQYEDDKGNPKDAVSAFNKLVHADGVPAVLGPFYSGNVLAVAPIANRERVVLLTGSATSDNIREAGEFVFRVCPSNDEQARTLARYARERLQLKSAFILYRNADYGVTLWKAFEKTFVDMGGVIVGKEAVDPDASTVKAQLTLVKAAKPDLIFAAMHYPEASALLRESKEMGVPSLIMGTDGAHDPKLLELAGNAAENSYWVTIGWGNLNPDSAASMFHKAYRSRYHQEPGVYSGLYYDAAHVLANAMTAVTSTMDGSSIHNALVNIRYEGPTGVTKFDQKHDVSKSFTVYQVKEGNFIPVQ
ncbi:MAG: ABC transporter substrate-binding protein [Nitrospirae bacterium]|nr:ABC transporter substrate-binding protein [Magnetococcales bacterium]